MKYIFVDTDNGTATPGTPVHTSSTWPANSNRFNTLASAVGNATVRAETDDITIYCQGVAADTSRAAVSTNILAASVTIEGNLTGPAWDTSKYRIIFTGSSLEALYVTYNIGDVTLRKLQVENDGTNTGGPYAIRFNTSGTFTYTIDSCIARIGCASGTATGYGVRMGVVSTATAIVNNTIGIKLSSAGGNRHGIALGGGTSRAYNCLAYNADQGISYAATAAKNCVSFQNTDDFLSSTVSYSASDDVESGTGNINGLTWADQFVDYANFNFNLKAGSSLIGAGIGPASDANVPTTDIAGNTRSGTTTDIGPSLYTASILSVGWLRLL